LQPGDLNQSDNSYFDKGYLMEVQIKEVVSLKDLRAFIRFPYTLYRRNSNWVPPLFNDEYNTLRHDKNPAFENCEARYWLAYHQGQIVGRIAAILNRQHIEKWKQHYMRFSWMDFIDDPSVSVALLATVESWARETGMTAIHGPLGFTDLDREGMLVEGFDELGTLATFYNHAYYPLHMEKAGYVKDIDWVEYEITVPSQPNQTIARLAEVVMRRNKFKLLQARSKQELLPYTGELFEVFEEAYKNLYGVVPLTKKQVDSYIQQYFGWITPDFVPIVLDENNHMVAFGLTLPSLSRALQKAKGELLPFGFIHILRALRKNDRADLYLIAVKPEVQGKGVNAIVINQVNETLIKHGIKKVESNPELESNQLVQAQWKYFDRRQHKRRRCFIKHIG
jgi:GNAT superfamily N-acetyltransferase